ncbi:MAG: hypothetical protein WEA09_13175 [Gemmatimonadota bacterium]
MHAQHLRLEARPAEVALAVGSETSLEVVAVDARGAVVEAEILMAAPRGSLSWSDGTLRALEPGQFDVVATLMQAAGGEPVTLRIPVEVRWPAIGEVRVEQRDPELAFYAGTRQLLTAQAFHTDGSIRPDADFSWRVEDSSVAAVDRFGQVVAHGPGTTRILASAEGVEGALSIEVRPFPMGNMALGRADGAMDGLVRTGDVVRFSMTGSVSDLPMEWGVEQIDGAFTHAGSQAGAQIRDGRFVADVPGVYRIHAGTGPLAESLTLEVVERDVVEELEVVGHTLTDWYRTTDLWVFEGMDGRDYAITGSKLSGGYAFFFDVTDPAAIVKVDSIQANGRTINDVKVSPDGRYAVMSREGASDRVNGIVVLDLANPRNPRVASVYDENLTGGVHNVFATNTHLFALSAGDKYVIIDMTDLENPRYVSEYDHPDSRIHDVWVHDGIAYSAEWGTGLVVVDVGNGRWGGSLENPTLVTTYALPTGATHAVFPYWSESAQKMYIFTGDEIMSRRGLAWAGYPESMGSYAQRYDPATGLNGIPLTTRGYVQIVDFTDPENPEMVARYEVPEFGTHNFWIEDDRMYQAYYEGGVRVVDVSGELMGNLYNQGREIAVFKPAHPEGFTPNATMVWGAQPFKGHVFLSDTNSGLWSVKLIPQTRPAF